MHKSIWFLFYFFLDWLLIVPKNYLKQMEEASTHFGLRKNGMNSFVDSRLKISHDLFQMVCFLKDILDWLKGLLIRRGSFVWQQAIGSRNHFPFIWTTKKKEDLAKHVYNIKIIIIKSMYPSEFFKKKFFLTFRKHL